MISDITAKTTPGVHCDSLRHLLISSDALCAEHRLTSVTYALTLAEWIIPSSLGYAPVTRLRELWRVSNSRTYFTYRRGLTRLEGRRLRCVDWKHSLKVFVTRPVTHTPAPWRPRRGIWVEGQKREGEGEGRVDALTRLNRIKVCNQWLWCNQATQPNQRQHQKPTQVESRCQKPCYRWEHKSPTNWKITRETVWYAFKKHCDSFTLSGLFHSQRFSWWSSVQIQLETWHDTHVLYPRLRGADVWET